VLGVGFSESALWAQNRAMPLVERVDAQPLLLGACVNPSILSLVFGLAPRVDGHFDYGETSKPPHKWFRGLD
jgi:hypothetical protein